MDFVCLGGGGTEATTWQRICSTDICSSSDIARGTGGDADTGTDLYVNLTVATMSCAQTTSDQLGVAESDVQVVSIDTSGKRSQGPEGEMQEVQINYLLSDGARARSA